MKDNKHVFLCVPSKKIIFFSLCVTVSCCKRQSFIPKGMLPFELRRYVVCVFYNICREDSGKNEANEKVFFPSPCTIFLVYLFHMSIRLHTSFPWFIVSNTNFCQLNMRGSKGIMVWDCGLESIFLLQLEIELLRYDVFFVRS